jgi:hypothetical protein
MVYAVVLLNVNVDCTNQVACRIAEVLGVSDVYSVAGNFDLRGDTAC